ncbi:MAG: thiol reductant ABC exporter subunit CydD [Candidatus Kinetoplastibacterium crithidii]|nr:thiol reductant ABC exporter subunit CydD [Candidatus Kinetoplastibacterium crithidii]
MEIKNKLPKDIAKALGSWLRGLVKFTPLPMFVAILAPLVSGVFLILQLWIFSKIVSGIVIDHLIISDLYQQIFIFMFLYLLRYTTIYLGDMAGIFASENIKYHIRQLLFYRIWNQGPQWTKVRISGEIAASIIDQVEVLDGFFSKYIPVVINAIVLPIVFSIFILLFDKIIGILLLVTIPLIPLFMALIGFGAEEASKKHLRSFSRLSGFFADRVRGLDTLKMYGREEAELIYLKQVCDSLRHSTLDVLKIAFISSAVLEFFASLGVASVALYIGLNFLGFLNSNNTLVLQTGLFFLLMAPEIYFPLRQMALHYHDRAAARAASDNIRNIFDGLPDLNQNFKVIDEILNDEINFEEFNSTSIKLSIRNLDLCYEGNSNFVLKNINLDILPGQHVCLLGPSGVGKTSLLEAIVGLRNYAGNISLNNIDSKLWPKKYLRMQTCLIGQNPYVFEGTIAENIMIGNPYATHKDLLDAAKKSLVLDFTNDLKNGLDTILGKNGRGLSRGQVQRISIARLFLRNPSLILLDEPTAHLDVVTELRLIDEIISFSQNKTLLIVTHSKQVSERFSIRWFLEKNLISDI